MLGPQGASSNARYQDACGMRGRAWRCACCRLDRERDEGDGPGANRRSFPASSGYALPHRCAGILQISRAFQTVRAVCRGARKHARNNQSTCTARRGKPNQVSSASSRARRMHVSHLFDPGFDAPSPHRQTQSPARNEQSKIVVRSDRVESRR